MVEKIIEVINSIAWVRCASGNVLKSDLYFISMRLSMGGHGTLNLYFNFLNIVSQEYLVQSWWLHKFTVFDIIDWMSKEATNEEESRFVNEKSKSCISSQTWPNKLSLLFSVNNWKELGSHNIFVNAVKKLEKQIWEIESEEKILLS